MRKRTAGLGALGCGLGCYVALRVGKQAAALRTAGFTVAFAVASAFVVGNTNWLVVSIVASALLARRVAIGSANA